MRSRWSGTARPGWSTSGTCAGGAPQDGADARWLEMARTVLAEHTDASTPTQDLILARIAARLDAEHGTGAVPLPSQTRARGLLREITKGASAFGWAKASREIADRAAAPYGRPWAARPGGYLLLDTARLGVFAMDPVTLRWVQCELKAGMDLYDRCITGLRLTPVSSPATWGPRNRHAAPTARGGSGQPFWRRPGLLLFSIWGMGSFRLLADDYQDNLVPCITAPMAQILTNFLTPVRKLVRIWAERKHEVPGQPYSPMSLLMMVFMTSLVPP